MIVCLCANVSEREVIGAIENGATSLKELGRRCGAGTGCGCCRATLRAYLAQFRAVGAITGAAQKRPAEIDVTPA